MSRILYSEFLKLKGSKILWMILVGAFLPAALVFMTGINNENSGKALSIIMLVQNSYFIFNILMAPPLFCLFAGFIVARENQDKTINQLYMYPQSRALFFLGKWLVLLLMIMVTMLLLFTLIIFMGTAYFHLPLTTDQFTHYLYLSFLIIGLQWLLTPLAMGVSMLGKSYIPSMVLGIGIVVCSVIVFQSDKYNSYFPFSAIPNLIYNWLDQPLSHPHFVISFLSIIITFVLSFIFSMIYYSRSSVHNG